MCEVGFGNGGNCRGRHGCHSDITALKSTGADRGYARRDRDARELGTALKGICGNALTAAKDNSFAYVSATVNGAKNVYLLDGNKLDLVCEGVDEVLEYAELVPGIIYSKGNRVEYYYDETTTSFARNGDSTPKNFVLSPDGTAVAYTIKNKTDSEIDDLYIYTVEQASPEARSAGKVSMIPVSISNGGEHVLAYTMNGETKDLYLIVENERLRINELIGSFNAVTCTNSDGVEVVFTTKTETEYHSYIYNCDKFDKDTNTAHYLEMGYSVPQNTDSEIAVPSTFKKTYFQNITTDITFYLNKKYERQAIAAYLGQFDPDMKYFYFINKQKEVLVQLEIDGGEGGEASSVATDVTDFVVTEKGNIYYTDGYGDLYFYKMSKAKPVRITSDVTDLVFYEYANDLYFEKTDSVEATGTYLTSEGSDYETFQFAKMTLSELPTFTNSYSKKSYAYAYDEEKGNYLLFYTSTGSSFKLIAECTEITSEYSTDIESQVKDLLS